MAGSKRINLKKDGDGDGLCGSRWRTCQGDQDAGPGGTEGMSKKQRKLRAEEPQGPSPGFCAGF